MCWVAGKTIYLASYLVIFFFLVLSDISACANDTILLMDLVSKAKKVKAFCSSICTDRSTEGRAETTWHPLCPGDLHQYEQQKNGSELGVTVNGIIHFTLCDPAAKHRERQPGLGKGWGCVEGMRRCLEKTHLHYANYHSITGIGICLLQKFWGACAQVSRYWSNYQSAYPPFMLCQGFYFQLCKQVLGCLITTFSEHISLLFHRWL